MPPREPRKKDRLQRFVFRTLPAIALLAALLIALLLVSGVQKESSNVLERGYVWVLISTVLALIILLWAIGERLATLVHNVRSRAPGALLAARWVRNFLILSLPPALIVFFFSAWFLNSTIDSWFDVRVEAALEDSLQLGQQFLDTRTLEVRTQLRETARELAALPEDRESLRRGLLAGVRARGPTELSLMEIDGQLIATANINALSRLPERPGDFALMQAAQAGEYAAAEPTDDGRLQIRVVRLMPAAYPGASPRFLQAFYPLPPDITDLTRSIEDEYYRYQNVSYLRQSLKQSFLLILSLVLLLTVLLAVFAALNAARRMVTPLSRLSTATRDVAAGDFEHAVTADQRDEIGFLVESFNEMTQALRAASREAEDSRAELQSQGEYLETVLGNLSSGVMTLDENGLIITANAACRRILGLPDAFFAAPAPDTAGPPSLDRLANVDPGLQPFSEAIRRALARAQGSWRQEVRLEQGGRPLVLLMRGSHLPLPALSEEPPASGHVIVFDDVTILNQAQREAAWAEAARRLAHEVKNPLTPIRLAAERLQMKLAGKLAEPDSAFLGKSSATIVAQVEALRKLVDAFGDYAREPELQLQPVRLDELVREIVALYEQGGAPIQFELELEPGPDGLLADSGRLRQLLHNLIRNADEAGGAGGVTLRIHSFLSGRPERQQVLLELLDDGPGFPEMVLEKPFEPYVSNKSRGSGLGLAICRKIVSEHDGEIAIGNRAEGGARVTITLPLRRVPTAQKELGRPAPLE
jgi:nitrogen fixation/metabolism regulation signal transduction histidine kinase